MVLKRHHKIAIGSLSTLVIIVLISNSVMLYMFYVKLNLNYNELETKIADSQSKISELSTSLIETREELGGELSELKATASADFSGIIEDTVKSVVTIRTDVAQGSGFIIAPEGYVVTNAHVLVGAHEAVVITSNLQVINAELIGYNNEFDVALLKIPGDYSYLTLANSDDIQVGEKVIAIGNPLGLQFSVSEGIISAVHRTGPNEINAYIQTDAALNPGNSGGPLINKKGEVIGINNFKVTGGESLGFALESNNLKDTINLISEYVINQTLIQ
jgi:serine protease Do